MSPDGKDVAIILAHDELLQAGADGSNPRDVLPRLPSPAIGQTASYLSVNWIDRKRLLVWESWPERLFTVQSDDRHRVQLPKTGLDPKPSPNGLQIALGFRLDQPYYSVYVTDTTFKRPRKLTRDTVLESLPAWSPDGQWIGYAANAAYSAQSNAGVAWEVRTNRADGSDEHTVFRAPSGVSFSSIRWSPDGKQLAVTCNDENAQRSQVVIIRLDDGAEQVIGDGQSNERVLAWLR